MENRLDIIKEYVKTNLTDIDTLKMLINEENNGNIIRNLANVYSDLIVHPNFSSKPMDYKIFSNLKNLINNCMTDFIDLNYAYFSKKFNTLNKNIDTLKKSLEKKNLLNDEWKNLIKLLKTDVYEMEEYSINKKNDINDDSNYNFMYSIIFDTENKAYLNHVLNKYPHLVNIKSDDNEHMIVEIINKFCELIKRRNDNNFDKIVYYSEIINKFLESPRFRVSNSDRENINSLILETTDTVINTKNGILKKKQKLLFLKSIHEKFIDSENKYDSIKRINAKYNISGGFSINAQKEILNITKNPNRTIITIDEESTLDMDDALSICKKDDYYILEVYITDVASHIQEGTYLDLEAKNRTETIYLSDNIIPMFPFELSNNILSLNNNGYKNVICYKFKIDKFGNIMDTNIRKRQVLISQKLSYNDVNTIVKEGRPIKNYTNEVYDTIATLTELSNILRKNNPMKTNYRKLEDLKTMMTGTTLLKNEYKNRTSAEIIVEETMILTNYLSAKILNEKGLPCIYRVHPKIEDTYEYEKLQMLSNTMEKGFEHQDNAYLKLLDELISIYPKAKYSNNNIGHYGLNLEYYSHASSPIRRYSDVVLQRIMNDLLFERPTDDKIKMWDKNIIDLCEHLNSQNTINDSYRSEYEKIKRLDKK